MSKYETLADAIAAYADAPDWRAECDIVDEAMPLVLTAADADAAIEAFGARRVGEHASNWADCDSVNEAWGSGCASMHLDDGNAIFAEWDSQGFWDVTVTTAEQADAAVDAANAELSEGEEEEDEDEADAE